MIGIDFVELKTKAIESGVSLDEWEQFITY